MLLSYSSVYAWISVVVSFLQTFEQEIFMNLLRPSPVLERAGSFVDWSVDWLDVQLTK
jgi:hypothetical protein